MDFAIPFLLLTDMSAAYTGRRALRGYLTPCGSRDGIEFDLLGRTRAVTPSYVS